MNENVKIGADIHAGDGGYSISTKEKYDAFVKLRNKSLGEARIQQLAEQAGLNYHNWMTNESNIIDGNFKYPRLEDYKKFAELIVKECIERGNDLAKHYINNHSEQEQVFLLASIADYSNEIKKHFGVEE